MKIAYITNLRAPYRTLQINEFSKINNIEVIVYYTSRPKENRNWNVKKEKNFTEIDLKGIKIAGKFGYINKGLLKLVRESDLIILGCYEQPTYVVLSILCKIYNKKYILSFDGISVDRLVDKEKTIKKTIKNIVIKNSEYIMGNGEVSRIYFSKIFGYSENNIRNQYLTVDVDEIKKLYRNKEIYRKIYREKLNIKDSDKVLIYSGRLVDIKNVESVIKAIKNLNKNELVFLITGGGKLEKNIKELSTKLGVRTIITGFIYEQEDLFKHYFAGDALILPSLYEPWGLVVNEAMAAGLPIIVSKICGCSLDLVKDNINGFIVDPCNIEDISEKINKLLYICNKEKFSKESINIIKKWNVENARKEFELILSEL